MNLLSHYLLLLDQKAADLAARAREDESGQGAVEYVGIVIVVVAIIAALAAYGPEIGDIIGQGLRTIVQNFISS